MTIQIDLNPELEEQLAAEARAHGIAIDRYATLVLQEAISGKPRDQSRKSLDEFRSFLDGLAGKGVKLRPPASILSNAR